MPSKTRSTTLIHLLALFLALATLSPAVCWGEGFGGQGQCQVNNEANCEADSAALPSATQPLDAMATATGNETEIPPTATPSPLPSIPDPAASVLEAQSMQSSKTSQSELPPWLIGVFAAVPLSGAIGFAFWWRGAEPSSRRRSLASFVATVWMLVLAGLIARHFFLAQLAKTENAEDAKNLLPAVGIGVGVFFAAALVLTPLIRLALSHAFRSEPSIETSSVSEETIATHRGENG